MENNMTQKQALMELLKRIKKYWHLLIGSLLFAWFMLFCHFMYQN